MSHISDPNKSVYDNNNIIRMNKSTVREEYDRAKRGFKIRINHGCLLSCSYCVIRNATGRLKSIPEARIIAALMDAAKRQEPTIMLMGGDTGAYGLDIGSSFAVLLGRLLAIEGNYLIFVHDFNINWFLRDMSEYMRTLMADSHRLRAICFPVQSGSDSILKRMRRPYKVRDVMHSLSWIKQHAPHIALGTHVIVGFPSEKESDFNQTIRLLCEIDFDFVTCFRYSEQSSAPSAKLNPKVPEEIKLSRLSRLHALLGERASIIV
jgi:MiaB/RimO family radical SAM methylthiotransferase